MEPGDLLKYVSDVFARLGVRYAVVGSVASSYYGEARLTNDVDIVADLSFEAMGAFIQEFPKDEFYLSDDAIRQAIQTRGQFNVIHPESGLKVDVILPEIAGIDQLRGRQRATMTANDAGFETYFASPADVILKKLEFYREGGSEKHLRDIVGILKVSGEQVDHSYILLWANKLGVIDIWDAVLKRAHMRQ